MYNITIHTLDARIQNSVEWNSLNRQFDAMPCLNVEVPAVGMMSILNVTFKWDAFCFVNHLPNRENSDSFPFPNKCITVTCKAQENFKIFVFGMFSLSFVDFMHTSGLNVHFYLSIEICICVCGCARVFVFKKWKICTASLNGVCAAFDHSAMPCCCFSTRHCTFVQRFHNEMKIRYMYLKACPCILNAECWNTENS